MIDPTRIPGVLDAVRRAWEGQPDLSLPTLFGVLANEGIGWGSTDEDLVTALAAMERTRPGFLPRIDDRVTLPRTGVTFPLSQLSHLQLYSRPGRGTYLVLLPAHVAERVGRPGDDPRALTPYTVRFPEGATPRPFELVELICARVPEVGVDKLPSEQPARNRQARRMTEWGCLSTVTHYRNRRRVFLNPFPRPG